MRNALFAFIGLFLQLGLVPELKAQSEKVCYFDETTMRYLTLEKSDFGSTDIQVRFAGDPGSMALWVGNGVKKDKTLHFARSAGEGEDRGAAFVAEIAESKVEIRFKEGQKAPQDAGINGVYKRISETKQAQLAKKEFQAANERLSTALKAAGKSWQAADRWALNLWKEQWPLLRERWTSLAPSASLSSAPAEKLPTKPQEPGTEMWLKLAQATARGYIFIETLPDPKTPTGWDGEYDDMGGGHASLRLGRDGKLRVSLSSQRLSAGEPSTIDGVIPPQKLSSGKNGELTAVLEFQDADSVVPKKPLRITLTKAGHYLQIETEDAQPHVGLNWLDGVYRGSPVPQE